MRILRCVLASLSSIILCSALCPAQTPPEGADRFYRWPGDYRRQKRLRNRRSGNGQQLFFRRQDYRQGYHLMRGNYKLSRLPAGRLSIFRSAKLS